MQVLQSPHPQGKSPAPVCVAIGFFDGVHLGHQEIIRRTVNDARSGGAQSLVITFKQHPSNVVAPARVPPLIYSLSQRLRAIEFLEADAVMLIDFDQSFSELTGEQFIRNLVLDLGSIQTICVGENFQFGHRRSGNVALLRGLGSELGFAVHGMPSVSSAGHVVSSTQIRNAIQRGDFTTANAMLGREYSVAGTVIAGDKIGRTLGFPTANLDITGKVLPPRGVYAAAARLASQTYKAVVNLGMRPTISEPVSQLHFEVHILDFQGDLYGVELEVQIQKKLREEKRFSSREALREQIARDISQISQD